MKTTQTKTKSTVNKMIDIMTIYTNIKFVKIVRCTIDKCITIKVKFH